LRGSVGEGPIWWKALGKHRISGAFRLNDYR
jgi:hypothetical protein